MKRSGDCLLLCLVLLSEKSLVEKLQTFAPESSAEAFFIWKRISFATPAPERQHGRRGEGYFLEDMDQTSGSPRSKFTGCGSLCCAPPFCCHGYLHDNTLMHPPMLV